MAEKMQMRDVCAAMRANAFVGGFCGVGCLLLSQGGKREPDGVFLLRRQNPLLVECFFPGVGCRRCKFAEEEFASNAARFQLCY